MLLLLSALVAEGFEKCLLDLRQQAGTCAGSWKVAEAFREPSWSFCRFKPHAKVVNSEGPTHYSNVSGGRSLSSKSTWGYFTWLTVFPSENLGAVCWAASGSVSIPALAAAAAGACYRPEPRRGAPGRKPITQPTVENENPDALVQSAMAWSFGEKVVAAVAAAGILWAIPRLLLFSLAQMEGLAVIALIGVEEAVAALLLLAFRYVLSVPAVKGQKNSIWRLWDPNLHQYSPISQLAIGGLFVLAATVAFLVIGPVAKKAFGSNN
ncbi:hypothetical protein WJX74_004296 [Apatococcus lobatus]|uniref:Uncharacterized protein n=1 Tax=Apatococcus lobatus TaxID=904363 RepID=A0AAW1RLF7_9CHLO